MRRPSINFLWCALAFWGSVHPRTRIASGMLGPRSPKVGRQPVKLQTPCTPTIICSSKTQRIGPSLLKNSPSPGPCLVTCTKHRCALRGHCRLCARGWLPEGLPASALCDTVGSSQAIPLQAMEDPGHVPEGFCCWQIKEYPVRYPISAGKNRSVAD